MSIPNNKSASVVELVYTYVLGTYPARGFGSSPNRPTKVKSVSLVKKITEKLGKSVYCTVYGMTRLSTNENGNVMWVLGYLRLSSLRNYHHIFFFTQVKVSIDITCVIPINLPLHLCSSLVDNRRQTTVDRHLCNVQTIECSRYVYTRKSKYKQ